MRLPTQWKEQKIWIAVNKEKRPAIGTSDNPKFTYSEVPKEYLKGMCIVANPEEESALVAIDFDDYQSDENVWTFLKENNLLPADNTTSTENSNSATAASTGTGTGYIERSLSGNGLHVIGYIANNLKEKLDKFRLINFRKFGVKIEIYTDKRYFVITEDFLDDWGLESSLDVTRLVEGLINTFVPSEVFEAQPIVDKASHRQAVDLELIKNLLDTIDPDISRDEWFSYIAGIANDAAKESDDVRQKAFELVINWSKTGKKFDKNAIDTIRDVFNNPNVSSGYSVGTLIYNNQEKALEIKSSMLLDSLPQEAMHSIWDNHITLQTKKVAELVVNHGGGSNDVGAAYETFDKTHVSVDDSDESKKETSLTNLNYVHHFTQIAKLFCAETHIFTIDGKVFTCWSHDRWVVDRAALYIKKLILDFVIEKGFTSGKRVSKTDIKSMYINEIFNQVSMKCVKPASSIKDVNKWINPYRTEKHVIAVQNGLLDVSTGKILCLHTPDFYNTGVLPCAWQEESFNESVNNSLFLKGLRLTFAGNPIDTDIDDNIDCLQLWFGYLLLTGYSEKKICILLGESDGGKSSLLTLMKMLVGEDYTTAASLNAFDKGNTEQFVGWDRSLLVGIDDANLTQLKSDSVVEGLKMVTSNVKLPIRQLYKSTYSAPTVAKLVITTNTEPEFFHDPKNGLLNRVLIWYCTNIPNELKDSNYIEKISSPSELGQVLRWAVQGAQRLLRGEKLRQPLGLSIQSADDFRESAYSPFDTWVSKHLECTQSDTDTMTWQDVYDLFEKSTQSATGYSNYFMMQRREGNLEGKKLSKRLSDAVRKVLPKVKRVPGMHGRKLSGIKIKGLD